MSDNIVEITQTADYTISIETSLEQNNNLILELSSPNSIDIISNYAPIQGLIAGNNIAISDNDRIFTISATGLQPIGNYANAIHVHEINDITGLQSALDSKQASGNYANATHTHTTSNIIDFNTSVSGLLPVKNIIGSGYVSVSSSSGIYNIAVTGLQPSGNYANASHTHTVSQITDFNTGVNVLVSGVYAPLISPNFSGIPTVPTAASGTNNSQIASTQFVRSEISNLVNSSPSTLDTLKELADALGNDANFATTVASGLGQKSNIGHTHTTSDITNFNSSVSGLLPITNITAGSGIGVTSSSKNFTISVTGTFGLTSEEVDDRISNLLNAGTGININYDDSNNILTISTSGLQPSGNYANSVHSHVYSDITNFASGVSNSLSTTLLPGSFINLFYDSLADTLVISASGLQPSGNYSVVGHSHTTSDITNFNSSVSGLLPVKNVIGSGYVNVSSSSGNFIVSVTGLQPSGSYANASHTHTVSNITDFNSSVSGLLPTISNSGDNRLLTSTGSSVGINAENNLTFNGSFLNVNGSGYFSSGIIAGSPSIIGNSVIGQYIDVSSDGLILIRQGVDGTPILSCEESTLFGDTGVTSILWGARILSDASGNNVLYWGEQNKIGIRNGGPQYTLDVNGSGNFASGLYVNNIAVSVSGHTHNSSQITDFNTSVSGLLPVKNIIGGTGISVSSLSGVYAIDSTGSGVLSDQSKALVTTVFNNTGSPIPKMTAVYINGGQGDLPTVSLAIATSDMTSAGTYGLTYETINNMSSGKVIVFGALTGLNTDQFNPTAPAGNVNGSVLYLSPTVSGSLTLSKPSAPNHIVAIGTIIRTHQNEGVIEVRIQNGFELEELHNVAISGASNGQFLQYNSSSGLWVPSSSGNFSTLSVNGTGVSVMGHTHTSSNITDFNTSVSGLLPVTNILGGSNITISQSGTNFTVAVTGSLGLTTEEVDDRVSNLLLAGSGIVLNYDDNANSLTISTSGLQPSGNYANATHSHTSSDITNFNSSVSGLLPTISNSGDNRILTSTGSSVGIIAENNLTFDGSLLNVTGSGNFNNIFISGVALGEIIDDEVAGLLVAGSGINLNYNDNANTLTINANINIINSSNLYLWTSFR